MAKDAKSKSFVKSLSTRKDVKKPEALGAFLGARKLGPKKFQAAATKGKQK